jgi:hypothetical protein
MKRLALLTALLTAAVPAYAGHPAECLVAQHQVEHSFALPHAAKAVAAKKLDLLVLGTGSSVLPGATGPSRAYPARLRAALAEALPGIAINVTTDIKSRRTAADMVKALPQRLASVRPSLIVWQTGTVDAMLAVDPDSFNDTLEQGIGLAQTAGADVVLVDAQYSPRTESLIALSTYTEAMRWVALQHGVPLFNRFAVMRLWADLGTFDFTGAPYKLEVAGRVHDCIGRLLADLVVDAIKPAQSDHGR